MALCDLPLNFHPAAVKVGALACEEDGKLAAKYQYRSPVVAKGRPA
jgi:hypothetical protein